MASKLPISGYILGLDVGDKRIGSAIVSVIARLPRPLKDITNTDEAYDEIQTIVNSEAIELVVVGIPRNLNGEETAQSQSIRNFAKVLESKISVPIEFADESLSSIRADEIGKAQQFAGASRDSLAACFILEEYIRVSDTDNSEDQDEL